jgi:hypothetical protein
MEKELAEQIGAAISQRLSSLAYRWRDESQYEDFAEYQKIIAKEFEKFPAVRFIKLNKKPFEAVFAINETEWVLRVNAKSIKLMQTNVKVNEDDFAELDKKNKVEALIKGFPIVIRIETKKGMGWLGCKLPLPSVVEDRVRQYEEKYKCKVLKWKIV